MLREAAKSALQAVGRTRAGRGAVLSAVVRDPRLARLDTVREWPSSLKGFEDLAFLFSSNQLNHGVISQQVDEAALLYRLVRGLGPATIVEIGRFKGGGTLLIAAAMDPAAELYSYDLNPSIEPHLSGSESDRLLTEALARYGLSERVHLVVGDSKTAEPPPEQCGLVLIDGDHSYAGARGDWVRWREFVRPEGHVLFHDAVDTGGFGTFLADVGRLVGEIERGDTEFVRAPGAGTLAHFVRQAATTSP